MTGDVGEMAEIRRELREVRLYVDDTALRERVKDWIQESHSKGDADTAEEYLERRLNELLADNEMYDAPSLSRGEDGFPSDCEDCRHYGSACPVLLDRTEVRWRERKLDQATTEREARRVYQQQALDVDCRVIPDFLDDWDNQHSEFIRRGQRLLSRVEDDLLEEPSDSPTSTSEAVPDGGETPE